MPNRYKPNNYNAVSPYFVVTNAPKLIDLIKHIFDAEELRRYERPDGSIMHAELKIDDSVLMFGEALEAYPPMPLMTHTYVKEVDATFARAIEAGCEVLEKPQQREGDPDKRGGFKDFAGNQWYIATQLGE